ncbi:phosphotransferase [Oceanisphaera pacifica]|uniref:Phosphotransferase n=1 Tax=Oceanisphaera pacifica TaxID=2818389 RepID=A0ABS3NGS0_9GAMM|nr:phosphotransferase [Oceanisphaera pacifica]
MPNALLARLPSRFRGQLIPLTGGLTNRCWKLITAECAYWLREGSADTHALGINRAQELQAHQAAAKVGLAPNIHFALPEQGILLLDWLAEPDWQQVPRDMSRLAQQVAHLHQLNADVPLLDIADQAAHYLRQLQPLPKALADFVPYFSQAGVNLPFQPVLCHHDINAANVMGSRPWLIDWEYAAYGDAAFELAVISDSFGLDLCQQQMLLTAYNRATDSGGGHQVSAARFQARLPWVHWLTALWAALQYQQTTNAEYEKMQQLALTKLKAS